MVSGTKQLIKGNIWTTIYPEKSIDVFKGKKQENTVDLLGTLAINGNGNTADIANFLNNTRFPKDAKENKNKEEKKPIQFQYELSDMNKGQLILKYKNYLQNNFNRLLTGRLDYTHAGKKIKENKKPKRYPNPIDLGYVIITSAPENTKRKNIKKYFLTLKGFFLVSGYELNNEELEKMINNASKVSLFFCFIKTVMDNSSVDFISEIFIKPIQKVLLRSDMFQGGSMDFYFGNFADAISISLHKKINKTIETRKKDILDKPVSYFYKKITLDYRQLHPTKKTQDLIYLKIKDELKDADDILSHLKKEGIESLMDYVFYSDTPREDWYDSLFDYFYPSEESSSLFLQFGYDEKSLMNKVMNSISLTYAYYDYGLLKYTPKKLPRSKAWKRNQAYKKPDKAFFKKYGSKFKPKPDFDLSHLD